MRGRRERSVPVRPHQADIARPLQASVARLLQAGAGRLLLAGILAAALLLGAGACGEPADLTVGGKNFSEQDVLGHLLADWIEATTDLTVERQVHLGGTFVCHRSLTAGEIDLYVEYTGTALTAILEREPLQDPDSVLAAVREAYRERWDLVWTEPLGFENTFALLVRREVADSLGLESFSDAADHVADWSAGFGYEFAEREDGLSGLRRTYGVDFGATRTMDLGLLYRALDRGKVDLIAGNSTDGRIDALGLAMLRDDRGYFPPYDAAPVVRAAALEAHPSLREALRRLGGRISTGEMRRLNREVDLEGRSARTVAREWVEGELAPR